MDWNAVLRVEFIVQVLAGGVALATPLVLTAIGETYGQRSGVLNLGLEGIMILSAFGAFAITYHTGNIGLGFIVGILVGALLGLVFAFVTITLRANQVVTALGILILGTGLSLFFYRMETSVTSLMPKITTLESIRIPFLSTLPVIGPVLFDHDIFTYIMFLIVPITAVVLYRSPLGLRITAVGEYPEAADTLGISVPLIRYICILIGGIMAGIGGAYFTLASFGFFGHGLIGGRGFTAVAIVSFGRWNPFWVLGGGLLFGIVDALQSRLQILGAPIPPNFLLMMPYVFTVVMLMLSKEARAPAALTQPYSRE